MAEAALRRAGRLADGWFPLDIPPNYTAQGKVERLRGYARVAGRDPKAVSVEAFLSIRAMPEEQWAAHAAAWRAIGATHLVVSAIGAELASPQAHIDPLRQARKALSGRPTTNCASPGHDVGQTCYDRFAKPAFDRADYRRPNAVERCVNRFKQWRGIATRFAKEGANYRAIEVVAVLMMWIGS